MNINMKILCNTLVKIQAPGQLNYIMFLLLVVFRFLNVNCIGYNYQSIVLVPQLQVNMHECSFSMLLY